MVEEINISSPLSLSTSWTDKLLCEKCKLFGGIVNVPLFYFPFLLNLCGPSQKKTSKALVVGLKVFITFHALAHPQSLTRAIFYNLLKAGTKKKVLVLDDRLVFYFSLSHPLFFFIYVAAWVVTAAWMKLHERCRRVCSRGSQE